jgi:hypothetical protein
MASATGCTGDGTTANRRNKKQTMHYLHVQWERTSFVQSGLHKYRNKPNRCHVSRMATLSNFASDGFIGQLCDQASHAINNILALEKSLTLLNENIHSLESQLMRNAFTDGSNVLQQLESSRAQYSRIVDSLHRKRSALGVNERTHLASLRQNNFLRIHMNAQTLKQRICDCLRLHKFELESLERAYRHTINGKKSQLVFCFIR